MSTKRSRRGTAFTLPYCFSEGYWLTGLIICDKVLLHFQKASGVLVILKIGAVRRKKVGGGWKILNWDTSAAAYSLQERN